MRRSGHRSASLVIALLLAVTSGVALAASSPEWVDIDYGRLIDRRQLTHSGQSVGALVDSLRRGDPANRQLALKLLDPWLEPYAFVLPDALDTLHGPPPAPLSEIGALWEPGDKQPAWAELLRSRALVLESDGRGFLRAFLPLAQAPPSGRTSVDQARETLDRWWSLLRHPLRSEQLRLSASGGGGELRLEVYPFFHDRVHQRFRLGTRPLEQRVDDFSPHGDRPPLDIAGLRRFLDAGLRLEGARVDPQGRLTVFGSQADKPPLFGTVPLSLADVAVAYRAVFRGGLAEPFMSLDRALSPQRLKVNFGGRLQDTRAGWISLLCDARFKTFSLGFDPIDHSQIADELRELVDGFATHVVRFARHPSSANSMGQQTRLWFYPDSVDLTVSPAGDLLAMRRIRLSAASERISGDRAEPQKLPPWTRALVAEINTDYDRLAQRFPELAGLDELSRWLALFAWLEDRDRRGAPLPELDRLLAVPLPAFRTPRSFPQMLSAVGVPAIPGPGAVNVYERLDVARGLEALLGDGRSVSPASRLAYAALALDPRVGAQARLAAELARVRPEYENSDRLDALAFRAERLRAHHLVLSTLPAAQRQELLDRRKNGESLRVFSVGIGGLDLGLSGAVARALGTSWRPGSDSSAAVRAPRAAPPVTTRPAPPPPAWGGDSDDLEPMSAPDHGPGAVTPRYLEQTRGAASGKPEDEQPTGGVRIVLQPDSPDAVLRGLEWDGERKLLALERTERGRSIRYRLHQTRGGFEARMLDWPATHPGKALSMQKVSAPDDLLFASVEGEGDGPADPITLRLFRNSSQAHEERLDPRWVERLILGSELDRGGGEVLEGLTPEARRLLTGARNLLLAIDVEPSPWSSPIRRRDPRRDPRVLGRALVRWRERGGLPAVAALTNGGRSLATWNATGGRLGKALLILPRDGFPEDLEGLRAELAAAFNGSVGESAAGRLPRLVVLASAEPPGRLLSRARRLAADPRMAGRRLAIYSLSGRLRRSAASLLLRESRLAAVGLASRSARDSAGVAEELRDLSRATPATRRPEELPGPFFWYY